ncbi:class I SAM-dependent methyltransferase [Nocardia fluminea]|uniref:class I SAM-dependent methyltransferase n=1 Tax=Nocardia fluminea TaxID=134984 RepID=UPI0036608005
MMPTWQPAPEPEHTTIGIPQPDLLALVDSGRFHGEVLDVGCGTGALTVHLAQRGYRALGVDLSESAIRTAREAATGRGLTGAAFEVADVTALTGFDGRFGTIVDSTLFHTLPPSFRRRYQESIVRAAAPRAAYFVLAFDRAGLPADIPVAAVTAEELREAVCASWVVDDIRAAHIHAETGCALKDVVPATDRVAPARTHSEPVVISSDRPFPAWLLSAHLE